MLKRVAVRRRSLAPVVLLLLGAAALVAPACRFGYEELDRNEGMLAGGDGNADAGNGAGDTAARGGAPVEGGAPGSGGSTVNGGGSMPGGSANGGSTNGGSTNGASGDTSLAGMPTGGDGGAGPGPACTGTADCTCDTLNGHTYWFCRQSLGWNDANAYCQTGGMTLVRIDNATENTFVLSRGTANGVFVTPLFFAYLGSNDQAAEGEWRWVDGTLFWNGGTNGSLEPGMYANWDNKSPSTTSIQRCSGMLATGLWQDRSCTALAPFICESP
jgi:hypothetical protein